MVSWTRCVILIICIANVTSLPTTKEKKKDPKQKGLPKDDKLRFEPQEGDKLDPKTLELLEQAKRDEIGRDAPDVKGKVGAAAGEGLMHETGHDEDQHKEVEEKPQDHVDTGAVGDGFVHSLMHDGEGDHAAEDERILQERPADVKDVRDLNLTEDVLKHYPKDAFKEKEIPDGIPKGPKRPDDELHGVLMHGDKETGQEHEHEPAVSKAPLGEDKVNIPTSQMIDVEVENKEKELKQKPPRTIDLETIVHGDEQDSVHARPAVRASRAPEPVDTVLGKNFMHNLMHGDMDNDDHVIDDEELKSKKVIRPRDLKRLGLDPNLLKHLDLEKMIKEDIMDYNRHINNQPADDNSIWNIFNTFKFRYFKNGDDIDDISKREPPEEEWDQEVVNMRRALNTEKKKDS